MLDKTQPEGERDILAHRTPPGLKLAGIVLVLLALGVVAWGMVSRVFASHDVKAWTAAQQIPTVQVIAIKSGKGGAGFTLPGDVEAFTAAPIYAQVSGTIQKWVSDIGSHVKAGALLAQIDPRSYQAALQQAQGQLARDAATLANARVDLTRYQTLAGQNAISAQQLASQQTTVNADAGVVQSDQANVKTAQINLSYTRIVAPFDGMVTSRAVDVGTLVTVGTASATPLFTLSDNNRLRVYVRLPQTSSALVKPGMMVSFVVPEYPGKTFPATLAASADAIVAQSGTQLLQFQVDNKDGLLKAGEYAQVIFPGTGSPRTVRVPVTALLFRDAGMVVAVVDQDHRARMRVIHIATDLGAAVDVSSGVQPGDRIIDNPSDALREGDLVHPVAKADVSPGRPG